MKTSLINFFKAITEAKAKLIVERDKTKNKLINDQIIDSIIVLDQLANDIMLLDVAQQADTIQAEADQLRELTKAINATSDKLAHVAKIISDITDKVDAVLQAASVLSGVGLLGA